MKPTKVTAGGEVKIIDSRNFPVTPIAAAIVRLKPKGLRELHWHPNADEWQYYISGKGRMTVFTAGSRARTMDFEEGDVGYIQQSQPHYIENTGDTDLVFLEMFKTPTYEDISLAEWMAHTPHLLMNQHLQVGKSMLDSLPKEKVVVTPRWVSKIDGFFSLGHGIAFWWGWIARSSEAAFPRQLRNSRKGLIRRNLTIRQSVNSCPLHFLTSITGREDEARKEIIAQGKTASSWLSKALQRVANPARYTCAVQRRHMTRRSTANTSATT